MASRSERGPGYSSTPDVGVKDSSAALDARDLGNPQTCEANSEKRRNPRFKVRTGLDATSRLPATSARSAPDAELESA